MSLLGTSLLVIEDNDAQFRDVQHVLLNNQPDGIAIRYIIQRASTLEQALRYIGGGYDLILLDLNLPDSTGFDTFEAVRTAAIKYNTPVIVTTVLEDVKLGLECYKAGAIGYIVKSWLNGNPLLLHFLVLSSIEQHRQAGKLRIFMAERMGEYRPLIQRCPGCRQRIGISRWKTESDGQWVTPDDYIEEAGIHFTDGICPECFDKYYAADINQATQP